MVGNLAVFPCGCGVLYCGTSCCNPTGKDSGLHHTNILVSLACVLLDLEKLVTKVETIYTNAHVLENENRSAVLMPPP